MQLNMFYFNNSLNSHHNKFKKMKQNTITINTEHGTEVMTETQFTDAIANIYNTRSAGWDYQHCGGVREEHIAEYIATLENTLFCGADIRKAVPDLLYFVDEPATIEEHAVTISGVFGSRFTACHYGSVYLFITLKK